jgi:hypothetical protein
LARAGSTPGTRAFVIGTTIGADLVSKAMNNAINDPTYVSRFLSSCNLR